MAFSARRLVGSLSPLEGVNRPQADWRGVTPKAQQSRCPSDAPRLGELTHKTHDRVATHLAQPPVIGHYDLQDVLA